MNSKGKIMKNDISVDSVLNNLSSIIRMGNFLEEKIAGKLFEDIETLILNQQNNDFPDRRRSCNNRRFLPDHCIYDTWQPVSGSSVCLLPESL